MISTQVMVGGMTCDGCERSIAKAISRIEGVRAVTADHTTGAVVVESDAPLDRSAIDEAIDDAGYIVIPPGSAGLPLR